MNATRNVLTIACIAVAAYATCARADFMFGPAVKFGQTISGDDHIDCFSSDGLEMYIDSNRGGGQGGYDLWALRRASEDKPWGVRENLGPAVNSIGNDLLASISSDGLTLYFSSDQPYCDDATYDIFVTTRATRNDPWGPAERMGLAINDPIRSDFGAWISPDNLELYINSYNRGGGYGRWDIFVARHATASYPWNPAVNLGPTVNTQYMEALHSLSPEGLLLLFSQSFGTTGTRPDNHGLSDLWMARRTSLSAPWQAPVNLGAAVNGPANDCLPRISPDGRTLYFSSQRSGSWDVWQAPITPNCDFNRDGNVDEKDLLVMAEHWGQDNPRYDIGPFPWGDGVVDGQDQIVLLETIEGRDFGVDPLPHAVEIPREVILRWTSPTFATTHDVYFGTSVEDVSTAGRDNPLGVLVSQGQTTTQYDPPGSLEFGRTYYWRIDGIGTPLGSSVYRGAVLDFTTEAYACPITSLTVKASSEQPTSPAIRTIDGSGLNADDQHDVDMKQMWMSAGAVPAWIQYTFDRAQKLHELWVWNANSPLESVMGFGAKDVTIEYSTDGETWSPLENVPQFAKGTGMPGYTANTVVDFDGAKAKHVKLTIGDNWGVATVASLSEVRFHSIPVYARQPYPADEATHVNMDTTLNWRPGREAGSHNVCFGTDKTAVADVLAAVETVAQHSYMPASLDFGTTYFWKVDEVNGTDSYEGEVWSFTTREYETADDFESYDDLDNCIYDTWIDGLADPAQGGSQVGYDVSPFAEQIVVHSGTQSMPLEYNNAETPFYSQTQRMFSTVQDWTAHGADTLSFWFRGNPKDLVERDDGSIAMSGGGADIWDTSDQFRLAYRQLKGDGSIVAKIHSLTMTHAWAKAGLMVRGSLDPASAYAFMCLTPAGRRAFQTRVAPAGTALSVHSNVSIVSLPMWLKLERKGNEVTGYYSADGKNWIVNQPDNANTGSNGINPTSISVADSVYIGLAVTSHNISMPAIAEFSNVSFAGAVTGEWQVEVIGVEQPSNDAAPLYVAVEDDSGHTKSVVHPDPAAVQTLEWQQWRIPLSEFIDAGVDVASVRRMAIGVGDLDAPAAGGRGVIYIDDIGFGHPLSSE